MLAMCVCCGLSLCVREQRQEKTAEEEDEEQDAQQALLKPLALRPPPMASVPLQTVSPPGHIPGTVVAVLPPGALPLQHPGTGAHTMMPDHLSAPLVSRSTGCLFMPFVACTLSVCTQHDSQ